MSIMRELFQKKKMIKYSSNTNYSPTKVILKHFLTDISYNLLKNADFNNASFLIDCYTYILFTLNPFFLEQEFDEKNGRDFAEILWNYLVSNELYICICRNDNFIE